MPAPSSPPMSDGTWLIVLNWLSTALLIWSGNRMRRSADKIIASYEELILDMAARLADIENGEEEKRGAIEIYRCFKKFQLERNRKKPFFGGPCS